MDRHALTDEALAGIRAAAAKAPGQWIIVAGGWTERQFEESGGRRQAGDRRGRPDHPRLCQLSMYSAVLLTRGGLAALGIAR